MSQKSLLVKYLGRKPLASRSRGIRVSKLLTWFLILATLPAVTNAYDYKYYTNNGAIVISVCYRCNGTITVPAEIDGLPVVRLGSDSFRNCGILNSVTIPDSITSIGATVFLGCMSLTNVTLSNNITNIGNGAFESCKSLTKIKLPNTVTSVGSGVFMYCESLSDVQLSSRLTNINQLMFQKCASLTNITIPDSVISIGLNAFMGCTNLQSVYFKGNAPTITFEVFGYDDNATIYYLPGTTGWSSTFSGRPTVLWNPQVNTADASFGVVANQFGFTLTGSNGLGIVVEACTDLANPIWMPVGTNSLAGGASYFSDPQWTEHPARFYRLRSP